MSKSILLLKKKKIAPRILHGYPKVLKNFQLKQQISKHTPFQAEYRIHTCLALHSTFSAHHLIVSELLTLLLGGQLGKAQLQEQYRQNCLPITYFHALTHRVLSFSVEVSVIYSQS